jgi:hypothetical protein
MDFYKSTVIFGRYSKVVDVVGNIFSYIIEELFWSNTFTHE